MKLNSYKDFEKLIKSIDYKKVKQKINDVKNHRTISEMNLSVDSYITFGTDVLCILYDDACGWKIKRKFNYYDITADKFFDWLKDDSWEILDKNS